MSQSYLPLAEIDKLVDTVLQPMSNTELNDLIAMDKPNLDLRLDEIIKNLPIVKKLEQEKELLITKNRSLAEFNLEKQPRYQELREKLLETHTAALELQQQMQQKQARLQQDQQAARPDVLRGLLQVAAQEAEEQSEKLANQFVAGEKPYEEFLEEFIRLRTQSHTRRIKYEKLIEHIQRQPVDSRASSATQATSSGLPTTSGPGYPSASSSQPPLYGSSDHAYVYNHFGNPYGNGPRQPVRSAPIPPYLNDGPSALPPYPTFPTPQPAPQPPFNQGYNPYHQ